jgi:hypothetical protein
LKKSLKVGEGRKNIDFKSIKDEEEVIIEEKVIEEEVTEIDEPENEIEI